MVELPKHIQSFIARDINYLIGGGCVVASFLYAFALLPVGDMPVVLQALAAGVAYMVGYALQDAFSVLRVVTTAFTPEPSALTKWMYRRFEGNEWTSLGAVEWPLAPQAVKYYFADEDGQARYQRLISLMMIGSTMSPCCLIAGVTLLSRFGCSGRASFDLTLGVLGVALSLVFRELDWLKAAEYTEQTATAIRAFQSKPGTK